MSERKANKLDNNLRTAQLQGHMAKRQRMDDEEKKDDDYERKSLHNVLNKVINEFNVGKGSVGSRSPMQVNDERVPRLPAPVPYKVLQRQGGTPNP